MKITLFNAISLDGFIADKNGGTDWVDDVEQLNAMVAAADAVVMGRKTYEDFGTDFPLLGCLNVVLTKNEQLWSEADNIWFTGQSPEDLRNELVSRGISQLTTLGGGELNRLFLQSDLIDEFVLDVHPVILGSGVSLFATVEQDLRELSLVSTHEVEKGILQLRYVRKK